MKYVIDTNSFQQLFGCYPRERFPSLWRNFDELVDGGAISSIAHVLREIQNRDRKHGELEWAQAHRELFHPISGNESQFLRKIFQIPRFRHVVPTDIRDTDAPADPYLIARAEATESMVVTQETMRGNRVRIPTICSYFDIKCGTLDDLMAAEGWSF